MAVLGATRAYADWRKANGMEVDFEVYGVQGSSTMTDEPDTPPITKPAEVEEPVREFSDDELKQLESEDPLSLIDSLSLRVGQPLASGVTSSALLVLGARCGITLTLSRPAVFRIEDYLPDKWRPAYDGYKQTLLELLSRTGIIYAPVPSAFAGSDHPDLLRARAAHTELVDEIRRTEGKRDEARRALEKDWGRDWEWKKLDGTCVEQNTGECVDGFPSLLALRRAC